MILKDSRTAGLSHYQVVILGAGPAASVVAMQLAAKGYSVLILSSGGQSVDFKPGESIAPSAAPVLKRLGVLQKLENSHHLKCYGNQSVWGSDELHDVDFMFTPYGYGWHLDRSAFDSMLLSMAQEAGARVEYEARIVDLQQINGGWDLSIRQKEDHFNVQADFLVDATGRSHWLTRKLGIEVCRYDQLLAFVYLFNKNTQTEDEDSRTFIEAVSTGWWYSALLPKDKRVVMYFTDKDEPTSKTALSSEGVVNLLEQTLFIKNKIVLDGYQLEERPVGKPANSTKALKFTGDHWLAVGDAACTFDPLSSQGIISAIEGAEFAAKSIHEVFIGKSNALDQYVEYINQKYNTYLENHYFYYSNERRWKESYFWKKMHENTFEVLGSKVAAVK